MPFDKIMTVSRKLILRLRLYKSVIGGMKNLKNRRKYRKTIILVIIRLWSHESNLYKILAIANDQQYER